MKNAKTYIFLLTLCLFLAGCRVDANWLLESEETLRIETYQPKGKSPVIEIRKGHEKYSQLKQWLEQNEKGWSQSPATYMPGTEVRGKKFALNFLHNVAILNFKSPDGKYHQYTKGIKEVEYQFLLRK